MENLSISADLLRELAPESGIDQDEQGGCVWCGGRGIPVAEDHGADCPWLAARRLLAAAGEPPAMRRVYADDPALRRLVKSRNDEALTTLTQTQSERSRDEMRRRTFTIIEDGPDRCVGVIVSERPLLRSVPLTISYLYVEPAYRAPHQERLTSQLINTVTSEAERQGFSGVHMSEQAQSAAAGANAGAASLGDAPNSGVFNFDVPGLA